MFLADRLSLNIYIINMSLEVAHLLCGGREITPHDIFFSFFFDSVRNYRGVLFSGSEIAYRKKAIKQTLSEAIFVQNKLKDGLSVCGSQRNLFYCVIFFVSFIVLFHNEARGYN